MNDKLFLVYITTAFDCKWCNKVKDLLNVYGYDFVIRDIVEERYKKDFLEEGFRTVPQVYLSTKDDIKHIGGYETTKDYLRNNFFENHPNKDLILQELKELDV